MTAIHFRISPTSNLYSINRVLLMTKPSAYGAAPREGCVNRAVERIALPSRPAEGASAADQAAPTVGGVARRTGPYSIPLPTGVHGPALQPPSSERAAGVRSDPSVPSSGPALAGR
jgi:hypothetical protein